MYLVKVLHILGQDGETVDERDFAYGTWQEIGYWLDHYGYNDSDYRLEIRFTAR